MYKTLNEHYREKFGCKVYKLSIDGGFTCPNRDGTIDTRGCIFCSAAGGGEFAARGSSVKEQLDSAKKRVEAKNKNGKYIAYFQAFTNTYASSEQLSKLYSEAIEPDYIVGLSVATRPDCLPDSVIELLCEINNIKPVSVELGLQTANDKTAKYIRRGYETKVYFDAVSRLRAAGLEVVTHIIIGLPNETTTDAIATTRAAVAAGTCGVKFHLLHILRDTDLQKEYNAGKFSCLSRGEYAKILKECIGALPPDIVVHRITGDGDKRSLIAPMWSADKKATLNYLNKYLSDG